MSWKGIFFFFFLFLCGTIGLKVEEATISSESILYEYTQVDAGVVSLKFSEELYMSNDLFCLPLLTNNPAPTCLPCSYKGADCPSNIDPSSFSSLMPSSSYNLSALSPCFCDEIACAFDELSKDVTMDVEVTERTSKVFRYEHNSWEEGFVIRKKATTNFSPTIAVSTSPTFSSDKIIAITKTDNIQVCPSHPLFGPKDSTVTYFISIQPSRSTKIHLSIETLPNDKSHGEPMLFQPEGNFVFWDFNDQDLDEGAYTRFQGRDIPNRGDLSPVTILFPFEDCALYSFRTEVIQYNGTFWSPDIHIGIVTQTEVDSFALFESSCIPEECFRTVEYLQLDSHKHYVPQDTVSGFCPKTTDEQNYLSFFFTSTLGDWVVDLFVRSANTSPFLSSFSIADPFWSHVQIQERLESLITLQSPCLSTENCSSNANFFDHIARRNFLSPNYFPSLLYPVQPSPFIDMMNTIAFQTNENYFLRCQERTRDSACGVLTVYRTGEHVSPLVYPALEPLYSLNALPTLYAQDLTTLFPSNGSLLTLFAVVGVDFRPVIDRGRFENSTLMFSNPNPLHTKSLNVFELKNIKIATLGEEPPLDCTFESFLPLHEMVIYFHDLLQTLQSGGELETDFFGIDSQTAGLWSYLLTWTKEWQSCYFNLASLQTFGTREMVKVNTTLCTDNNLQDPCCNPRLQWNECCLPDNRDVVEVQALPLFVNEEFIDNNCDNPSCIETFSEDFREVYQNAISDAICLVNDEVTTNITSIFQFCTARLIGEKFSGVSCYSDDECDIFGDPNASCDLKVKKCIADPESRDNAFLECLIDRMESTIKTLAYQALVREGVADPETITEPFLTADLLRKYAADGETRCFDDYGPLYDHHEYFTLNSLTTTLLSTCPVCGKSELLKIQCLTTFACDVPIQCQDISETCLSNFVAVSPLCESPPQENYVCNWDNMITDDRQCEEEEYRCMFCFNSSYCVAFEEASNQEECESTPVCLLADGLLMWGIEKSECETRFGCSVGSGIGSEEECLQQGICEDPDHISESIEALILTYPQIATARNGVCITPLSPYNAPACPLLRQFSINSLDFATQRGCVRIGQCVYISGSFECPQDPATEEDCINNYGGEWLRLPISNQQDCENPLRVRDEDFPGFCDLNVNLHLNDKNIYLSPKNKTDCEACGGKPASPAEWKTPFWERGKSVMASWRKAAMVPPYQISNSTISYFKLEDLFVEISNNYQTFIFWSAESCFITPFADLIAVASCNCPTSEQPQTFQNPLTGFPIRANDDCQNNIQDNEVIGTIWFCPTRDFQIGVITGVVVSLQEYVSGDLCFFSEITLAPTSLFVGNRPSEPVTVTNDPNELDPSPVRNQKGASVGIVLGDGLRLELSHNTQPIDWAEEAQGVRLVFSIDQTVFKENNIPSWYVLDFGLEVVDPSLKTRPDGEIELQPVGAMMRNSVGQQVANFLPDTGTADEFPVKVDGILLEPFRYGTAARVFPIARLPDWESVDTEQALTSGEQAMTGIFAGLYGLAFFATLFFLFKGLYALNLSLLLLYLYILATFSFRTAFWGIVASGGYEETSASYFILIEPPSFFIVSVLTVLIMSYGFIVAASRGSEKLGTYWLAWLALQLFLIAVLFVVIGLMIGLDNNDAISISCYGRQSYVQENTTIRDIRIAYHSFLLFVAIICAVIVFKIGHDLPGGANKSTLQGLSALAGLAVVLTSLLWVIYSAIDEPSPYFVIPLFFTEVPPLILMCYLTFPSQQYENQQELDL